MISLASWILWVHILAASVWIGGATGLRFAALPLEDLAVCRRLHFLTSRAMELLILTGLLNILVRGFAYGGSFSTPFFAMLTVKMGLLVAMAALQIWMGASWREAEPFSRPGRFRIGLLLQCLLGALAVLLGLGLRAV
jgi:putative copper export protein